MTALHELLSTGHRDRSRAVRELPASPALAYALRRVLFTDAHAEVRAAAARRLADLADVDVDLAGRAARLGEIVERDGVGAGDAPRLGDIVERHGDGACDSAEREARAPRLGDIVERDDGRAGDRAEREARVPRLGGPAERDDGLAGDGAEGEARAVWPGRAAIAGWLVEALDDGAPLVRDATLRALARVGGPEAVPALRERIAADMMWWIRRGAVYALAAIAGAAEAPAFTAALADPFWRVRQAAVRVLAVLGARDPEVREEVLAAPPSSTLTFLRASWGPVAIDTPTRAASATSRLPEPLRDPDPAVLVKRLLEGAGDRDPVALVELLCDPHEPLRLLAAERILAHRGAERRRAFELALEWLEEARIPHVVETVYDLLDRVGDPIAEVAAQALARDDRPGAARWAIGWVVATRYDALYDAARARARRGDAALRRLVLRLVADDELVAWAADDAACRAATARGLIDDVAVELHGRHTETAHAALARLDGSGHPRVRALQVDAAARRSAWDEVVRAAADADHGPRAIATRWLVRNRLWTTELDADPSVREAGLTIERAARAILHDDDPFVRRAAIELLSRCDAEAAAIHAALADADPWVRAKACTRKIEDDATLALVVGLLGDREDMVRAAAHAALARLADSDAAGADARLRAMLPALPAPTRRMAHAWLARELDDAAAVAARDALAGETDDRARALLAAVAGVELPDPVELEVLPGPVTEIDVEPREVARRPFGRAGFDVAPLAISGAYDLSMPSLEAAYEAGANLYFWEPGYDTMARFLRAPSRRDRVRVVTGTYNADAPGIRRDVDRALKRLRRDTLDVFLLFWARSPARLDDEAFAIMDAVRRSGKVRAIGFSTHHRDWARAALERAPWDVAMVRHSAAHTGIETALLPTARDKGAAVLTFSALTYGRMLTGPGAPSPVEAYRYTVSQPGVTACISAPRTHAELLENLAVLGDSSLPAERMAELRAFGLGVRAESQRFNALLRQPTRDAAAAAREMLAAETAPTELQLPAASGGRRRSKTRLGRARGGVRRSRRRTPPFQRGRRRS